MLYDLQEKILSRLRFGDQTGEFGSDPLLSSSAAEVFWTPITWVNPVNARKYSAIVRTMTIHLRSGGFVNILPRVVGFLQELWFPLTEKVDKLHLGLPFD